MEQILNIQEEFDQIIDWTEKMFNVQIKVDEWTGTIKYSLKLNFEFARFQKENNPRIVFNDRLILHLNSTNGKLDFANPYAVELSFDHNNHELGHISDFTRIEIKDSTTGSYECFYPHNKNRDRSINFLKLDDNERKDLFYSILDGMGRKIRVKINYSLTDVIEDFWETILGEIIEAVSVDKKLPNITLVHFLQLLEIVRLYEIIYEKDKQQKPSVDNYLESLPSDEYEKITQLIDEEYDYFKGIFESFKSISSTNEENIQRLIRQISTIVNIDDVNVLELVVYKPYSIPCIKEFCDYCLKNDSGNNAYQWINNKKYNMAEIGLDIERNRHSGCLLFFKKNLKPEFGPETKRFISDFKKHFNTK